ncbi:hypothetical protein AVEN_243438-1 [Araneus ventricosus]|uniref:C2H2-type domain-containing protein n=1 Tax=Araneus ventricosus TaxID=182803 RepID=A0A4Y2L7C0_ARAVE|nr:hypothetical protein AVEN_243438-1 [Araneus ventricosus]
MEPNDTVGKDMMLKLKESFSLKSFSSTSYHSSLICKSKTIRMDVNLIDGKVLTSASASSSSNFTVRSFEYESEKNREASSWREKNLENSEVKNKSAESSSVTKNSPKSENIKELLEIGDSLKSSTEDGKIKLKTSAKHSYQAKSRSSFNQIQTKAKPNVSEFESFRCDVCMKYFSSKRNVKRHSILHSLERHPCEACGKVFQTKENLKRHCRAIHEVKVKSLKCSKCYKAFSRKSNLNIHLKKHPDHVQLSTPTDLLLD